VLMQEPKCGYRARLSGSFVYHELTYADRHVKDR
jgi:hypothetical protein